jgi:hypothetical protein
MYKITVTNLLKQSKKEPQVLYTRYLLRALWIVWRTSVVFIKSYRKAGKLNLDTAYSDETPDGSSLMFLGVIISGELYDILEVKLEEVEDIESYSFSFA